MKVSIPPRHVPQFYILYFIMLCLWFGCFLGPASLVKQILISTGPPGKINKHFPFEFQVLHSAFQHQQNLTHILKVLYRFDMYGSQQGLVLCVPLQQHVCCLVFLEIKASFILLSCRKHVADFTCSRDNLSQDDCFIRFIIVLINCFCVMGVLKIMIWTLYCSTL